jgi:hypothetical protein
MATPIIVAGVGFFVSRRLKRLEMIQWGSQRLAEKHLEFFETVAPLLNQLLCFFTEVGSWKEIAPPEAIAIKRRLDEFFSINAPLYPPPLTVKYQAFMKSCFETFSREGEDAKIRLSADRRARFLDQTWRPEWDRLFAPSFDESNERRAGDARAVSEHYRDLVDFLAEQVGVQLPGGRTPQVTVPR